MNKIVIYQVFTRLFGNRNTARIPDGTLSDNGTGKFQDFDNKVLRRIRDKGVTHIWYTGVIRHASVTDYSAYGLPVQEASVVKGKAGSPYAICDYYDVDPDLAVDVTRRMSEWEALISRTHAAGMKVITDFVSNHVARQYRSICKPADVADIGERDVDGKHFSPTNDFYYCVGTPFISPVPGNYEENPAKATGNDCFSAHPSANDWYETVKLNYGIDYCDWSGTPSFHFTPVPPLWDKMTAILLFWAGKGIDAFRCDMAEMVPAEFWDYASTRLKAKFPNVKLIGEVYNPALYRRYIAAGFDYLYDKVGMYDTLRAIITSGCPTAEITRRWQETDDIRGNMLYFLENHDEQRIASDFFAHDGRKAVPAFIVAALLMSNPVMLYAGQEYGERGMDAEGFSGRDGRTTIFDYWSVESIRRGYFDRRRLTADERQLESLYTKILNVATKEKTVADGASFDLMYVNPQLNPRQYAFLRGNDMLVVTNFDDKDVAVPVVIPQHAFDFLHIKEQSGTAVDLLSGKTFTLDLQADRAVNVGVPANGGVVLKW
ncbi:MAG: alpha-amylase family protein [Prevotella sp.]|nr:alpha-amylase family protein [Prevotella sp.]